MEITDPKVIQALQAHETAIRQLGTDIELIKDILKKKHNQESISEEE